DRVLLWATDVLQHLARRFEHGPSLRTIGLGVAALLVMFVVLRSLIAARPRDDRAGGAPRRRGGVATAEDAWLAADVLTREGRYEDAAHALYRGVMQSIGQRERLRLDPAKTSGDYARELRRRGAPSLASYRAFIARFDVVVYGHRPADATALDELQALAGPFRATARAA
ncbi:MAG: DUF4129 domain-containing protein, partial [Polaromonas sp.]|nr:DUF4129 domain-containing protein [Gemmatimonadaceae bacterium]